MLSLFINISDVSAVNSTFNTTSIVKSADSVKKNVDTKHNIPSKITVNNKSVTSAQYLYLLTTAVSRIDKGSKTSITLKNVSYPTNPSEKITSGSLTKSQYLSLNNKIITYINTYGKLPNYVTTSLGTIRYENLVYTYSKILSFYKTNNRLPNYVSVSSWTSIKSSGEGAVSTGNSTTSSSLQKYLSATANAPSNSATIINKAKSITQGLTSDYDKAKAIFNWVSKNLSYSFYYNSQKGALGALSSKTANCCDTSHLIVALSRAVGVPARYQHGTCHFDIGGFVGTYGHVWAQLYVNGKWYYADAVDNSNALGVINNWNLKTYSLHGTYAALPF